MKATGDELVRKLVEYMAGQEDVLAGYLFGSHATGQARPDNEVHYLKQERVDYLERQKSS